MSGFATRAVPNVVVFLSGLAIMLLELVAARLVAKHIGSSLETWTTVIGVILAGMSLGNYWGGRMSDQRDPAQTLPHLVGGSAVLCALALWANDFIGGAEWMAALPQPVRIVGTIGLVFFPPACLLGTITPTAARWAIQHSARTGSAIGNISAWATAGNILGTFLTGFVLLTLFGVRSIVLASVGVLAVTAAGLLVLARTLDAACNPRGQAPRLAASHPKPRSNPVPAGVSIEPGSFWVRAVPNAYVFASGLSIMIVELVGSRFLAREAGASIYTWTALIGVVLAGITVGNYLGGLLADRFTPARTLPHLFVLASILAASLLYTQKYLENPSEDSWLHDVSLPVRIFVSVTVVFFSPCCALGMISPVTAKLALERARQAGSAIGNVYAWGAIGSIFGTFLTGFLLFSALGTQAVVCVAAGLLALIGVCMATSGLAHAIWAGTLMAFALAALAPDSWMGSSPKTLGNVVLMGQRLGIRQVVHEDEYLRESNYYTIKVYPPHSDGSRTLVLDNLIHGYVVKDDPRTLKYDYELIYASIMERAGALPTPEESSDEQAASARRPLSTLFVGGGSYTYPRYVQACYPGSSMLVAEIDPAVTRAAHEALYLPQDTPIQTMWGDARATIDKLLRHNDRVERGRESGTKRQFDFIFGDAFNDFSVPWHLTTRQFNEKIKKLLAPGGVYMINIIDDYDYCRFLGAYVHTARRTFGGVEVFCVGRDGELSESRETWVIAMTLEPMDFSDLGTRLGERLFEGLRLSDEQVAEAIRRSGGIELTDDYAPVENLLEPVARDR
jgi:MFS family permease